MLRLCFAQMHVPQLHQLEKTGLADTTECPDLLHELLSRAYRFRALCPVQAQLAVSFNEPFYHPRDYVDLIVDSVRIQSTLRFGIQARTWWFSTGWAKKFGPQTHDHNSVKSKVFTGRFFDKFVVKWILKIPPHLAYVATLPCETLM